MLIDILKAEGLFAAANIFSALKLVHLFSINPHLGPLQISLGRMVIDIVKFFFIYTLVLFAFACGKFSHEVNNHLTFPFPSTPVTIAVKQREKVSISCCGIMLIWRKPNATAYHRDYRIGIMRVMLA